MQRLIEVLTPAPPMKRKARYLCTLSFMAAMLVLGAAPAGAQDYSVPTYGPNGPYYGPYDYCVWSPYACADYSSPAGYQGYSALTYGSSGPYYGPYDYCVWSAYACQYY
jgi:hypothetical protein